MPMPLAEQFEHLGGSRIPVTAIRRCRTCGCTDADCSGCIERTGSPCSWVEPDLCSACEERSEAAIAAPVEAATMVGGPALAALPWTVEEITVSSEDDEREPCIFAADDLPVAHVLGCPDADAVARLICAAPDLLAACETALRLIQRVSPDAPGAVREACALTVRELQAAVTKARG